MKLIPLRGKYATGENAFANVDDEDYDLLIKYKWYVAKSHWGFYAHTWFFDQKINNNGKIPMHRLIMKVIKIKCAVDHVDHNGLNNQKNNLRLCFNGENTKNKNPHKNSSSKYLGVSLRKSVNKWVAQISIGGRKNRKVEFLGYFPYTPEGEIAAAKAYDGAAKIKHGEFANLNFKE